MSNALKLSVPDGILLLPTTSGSSISPSRTCSALQGAGPDVQWLGPRWLKMEINHYDFRTGGSYSYIHTGPDGVAYEFSGVFLHRP